MESSSKKNDDGNDNNKEIKKIYQENNSSASHFMVFFFLPRLALHDCNLRLPNPMFYGGHENTTKNFPFSF